MALLGGSSAALGGVGSGGAWAGATPFVGLAKYFSNIWGEISTSGGPDSTGGVTWVPAFGICAGVGRTPRVGGAFSDLGTTAACAFPTTGGATPRARGPGAAENRREPGPTVGNQPGHVEAPVAALSAANRTKDNPCRLRNRLSFMGLIPMFLKTTIRRGIGGLDGEL
jgi:hypothetical protein